MQWSGADRAVPTNGQQSPPRRWRVCVLGDAHLDLVISLDGQLAIDTDTPVRTRLSAGGQAANVAAWVAPSAARPLIAARGTDLAGEPRQRRTGPPRAWSWPGRSSTAGPVSSCAHRRPHRGRCSPTGASGRNWPQHLLTRAGSPAATWLHLPAYSLVAEPVEARRWSATARSGAVAR